MDFLAALGHEAGAFYAATTDLHRRIPTCPGWDAGDLVFHLGSAHRFWRKVAEGVEDEDAARRIPRPQRPDTAGLVPWAEQETDQLLSILDGLDPTAPRWTWSVAPDTAAFIPRRMAHETAVHRWDMENAASHADPIRQELAIDGIDEFLALFVPRGAGYEGPQGVLRLEATDAEAAWTVQLEAPYPTMAESEREPDRVVRAGASTLLLMLWERVETDDPLLAGLVAASDRD